MFADGTNAAPLIAALLLAISRIPLLLILFVLLVNAYFLKAYIPERTKQYIVGSYALNRDNATLRSVTASSMAIGLGIALTMLTSPETPNLIVLVLNAFAFWVVARLSIAFAEIIGLLVYTNSVAVDDDEKKSPILVPVLIGGSIQLLWSLLLVGFLKRTLPAVSMAFATEFQDASKLIGALIWFPVFLVLAALITAGAIYYACRIAYTWTSENTEVF